MNVYKFNEQLKKSFEADKIIDEFLRQKGFEVSNATSKQQRLGIDRVLHKNGKANFAEYKTDYMCQDTGNLTVEIISVDRSNKLGWAFTSQSYYLVWLVWHLGKLLIIKFSDLRKWLPFWLESYETRPVKNKTYNTIILKVPYEDVEAISVKKFNIDTCKNKL